MLLLSSPRVFVSIFLLDTLYPSTPAMRLPRTTFLTRLMTLLLRCADEELASKLAKGGKELASYILMQRIKPATNTSTMVRKGKYSTEQTLSELGVYGVYLQVKDDVVINECVGHLLRTKTASSNEGGVAAGFAVLDSPYLA